MTKEERMAEVINEAIGPPRERTSREIRLKDIAVGLMVEHRGTKQRSKVERMHRADKQVSIRTSPSAGLVRIGYDDLTKRYRHVR